MTGLQVRDLSVDFGPTKAVDAVAIDVLPGQVVGLIGPNGAGKTTAIDAITGYVPARGTVMLDDADLTRFEPHRRARAGVVRTFQGQELFEDQTCADNVLVAADAYRRASRLSELLRRRSDGDAGALAVLERFDVAEFADVLPGELPRGARQLVALARAVVTQPRILLLDEPAAGLDRAASGELGRHIRRLASEDVGVLLVDHDIDLVLEICDYVVVLDLGRVIARGIGEHVRTNPAVKAAYLGEQEEAP